jgi:hypothetical protein
MLFEEHVMTKRSGYETAEKQVRELTGEEIATVNGGAKIIGIRKWPNLVLKQG